MSKKFGIEFQKSLCDLIGVPEESRKQESPIKASPKAKRALRRIAEALGVRQIDALDWAAEALEAYYEHHGKRLLLPLRFQETFSVQTLPLPAGPMILPDPLHELESVRVEDAGKTRKSGRSRGARG